MTIILPAVILRHQPIGENDLLVTFFTKEKGKLTARAKGVRKAQAKLRGLIEVGNEIKIMLAPGKNQIHIAGGEIIDSHLLLRQDLELMLLWQSLLEVVNYSTVPNEIEQVVYDLIVNWSKFLQSNFKKKSPRNPLIFYLLTWQFFSLLGFQPQLYKCLRSNQLLSAEDCFFSVVEGGVVKAKYANGSDLPLSLAGLKILRYLLGDNFWNVLADVYRFKISQQQINQLEKVLIKYTESIIEKKINSLNYLQIVNLYGNKILA